MTKPKKHPLGGGRKRLPYDRKKYVIHGEVSPDHHKKYLDARGGQTNREILEHMIDNLDPDQGTIDKSTIKKEGEAFLKKLHLFLSN